MATEESLSGTTAVRVPYSVLTIVIAILVQTLGAVWWAAGFSGSMTQQVLAMQTTLTQMRAESYTRAEAILLTQRLDQANDAQATALTNRIAEVRASITDIRLELSALKVKK